MGLPRYLRLLVRPLSLNFEEAGWELWNTLTKPRQVYRSAYYRHQTRGAWGREDPSFVILFYLLIAASSLVWGVFFSPTWIGVLSLSLRLFLWDFVVLNSLVAIIMYYVAGRFCRKSDNFSASQEIERQYCLDVQYNAFVAVFTWLYVVQFLMLPIINHENIVSVLIGNFLYLIAVCHYAYITFLGYSTLPFLHNTEYVLVVPVAAMAIAYVVCSFTKTSILLSFERAYLPIS